MSDSHDQDDDALTTLYREGASEAPPTALDRRILAAAAAAAQRRRRPWLLRPLPAAGFATAAVLVLAVALLLDPLVQPALEAPAAPPAASLAEPSPAPTAAPKQRASADDEAASAATEADLMIEEIVVTGARAERRSEATRERAAPLNGLATAAFIAAGCPEAFPVPPGAVLKSVDDGLEITLDDATFTVRCVDGTWLRQSVDTGSADNDRVHNNR